MTGGREAARRPTRVPLRRRSRQRWPVAGGVVACWLVLEIVTGSAVSATLVLMVRDFQKEREYAALVRLTGNSLGARNDMRQG